MAKVLVVADTEAVRDWVVGVLQRHGIETLTTADPRKVFELVAESHPEVVVANSQIGSMGMVAVTREIKSAEEFGTIRPTAVCLLLDRRADVFLARRAEADAWLVNPVHPSALRWTVDRLIEAPSSWSEDALNNELAGNTLGDEILGVGQASDEVGASAEPTDVLAGEESQET